MATSDYFNQVQKLYIAYFGRPADPTGLNYWANQVNAAGGNITVAIAGFAASTESTNLFGALPSAQKISAIYLNLFNRLPESAGLSYWMNQLDSGAISQAQAAWEIMNQAGAGDATSVANKLTMANVFTAQVDTTAEIAGYNGAQPAAYGRAYLAGVDATPGSVSLATTALNNSVADATGVRPTTPTVPTTPSTPTGDQVFTLTTGPDNFSGGPGKDTFIAKIDTDVPANTTISNVDSINSSSGTDTLSITVTGALGNGSLPALKISNVEKLVIRDNNTSGATSFYSLGGLGFTDVTSDVSTATNGLTFGDLGSGATLTLLGDNSQQVTNVAFSMAVPTDAVNLVFDGGLKDTGGIAGLTTVTNFLGSASSATITSNGVANTLGAITLAVGANSIKAATINANTDLTATLMASDYTNSGTLTVTGAGKVDLGRTLGFDGSTINASANSGGLTIAVDGKINSFTGGKGNDTVVGTTPVADTVIIDGGAGTDTFSVAMINGTNGAAFKSFEVIDLGANSATVDVSMLTNSTITGVVLRSTTATTVTVEHLKVATDGFEVTSKGGTSGAMTVLQFDNATGTNDVLKLIHDSPTTYGATGKLAIEGVEIIKIASGGSVSGTYNSVNIVDNAAQLIEISGNQSYSLTVTAQGGTSASQLSKIDGSQATGPLTIKVEAATATGGQSKLDLLGGSGADTFIVETSAVANSTGVTVTTNGGNDTVNLFNATVRDASAPQYTTITDAQAGDMVQFSASINLLNPAIVIAGGTTLLDAFNLATSSSAHTGQWFVYNGDAYIVYNRDAATGFDATDTVVKLSGVTDLSGVTVSGGNTLTL